MLTMSILLALATVAACAVGLLLTAAAWALPPQILPLLATAEGRRHARLARGIVLHARRTRSPYGLRLNSFVVDGAGDLAALFQMRDPRQQGLPEAARFEALRLTGRPAIWDERLLQVRRKTILAYSVK